MTSIINVQNLKPLSQTIPVVASKLNFDDYLGAVKVRWGIQRDNYTVEPGLYKTGNPDSQSDVFVSANYKLSFDTLRKNLHGINAWILVIDTKGINVWCAAGKGTFSTENIVNSIKKFSLADIVKHRNIIVPQLGATGVSAHKVKEGSGFRVIFGPIRAEDIKAFLDAGYKATPVMRRVTFSLFERAKLIPVDLLYRKYYLLLAIAILFFLSGLDKQGLLFNKMLNTSIMPLLNVLSGYISGIVFVPLLLPFIPFRAFAAKGALIGALVSIFMNIYFDVNILENIALAGISLAVSSFQSMNFTGSSTFTSLSGVKKEMKWAIPFQISFAGLGLILFIISKLIG